jgi:hypothetical protein
LDSSDGFWRSVTLLGGASGVGAEVWADRLPLSSALRQKWAGDRAEEMALVGGEDYELVFTARPDCVRRISALGFARVVGTIVSSRRDYRRFITDAHGRFPLSSNILTVKKVPTLSRETTGEAETLALARQVGGLLKPSDWVALMGDLGSGQNCFREGLGRGALNWRGLPGAPRFPSFKFIVP